MSNVGKRLAPSQQKPKRGKLTWQQIVLIVIVVILALLLAATLALQSIFVRPDLSTKKNNIPNTVNINSNGTMDEPEEIDWGDGIRPRGSDGARKSEDYWTVLILGLDTGGGGHTDTMMLASYDVTNQKATVMSIPRDTMVNVPWDVKKINSVYLHYGGGEKGLKYLYKEISQLVGFEPDFQVVVEWEAVGKLVDAIGGVDFNVPYPMDYHDPYQDLVIEQAQGLRHLSGDDAMQVIRWRKNDKDSPYGYHTGIGDEGRMKLQQDFIKELIKQMLTIQNMGNIRKIAKVFDECVETDLTYQNIFWFAQQAIMGGLKIDDVDLLTMPWRGVSAWSPTVGNMQAYVVPYAKQLLDLVNNQLSPFQEVFTMSDLDIMSVNSDGTLRSSTGYVEDKKATVPPVKPEPDKSDEPAVDEDGNPVNPETGNPVITDPENSGGTNAETGSGSNGGTSELGGTEWNPSDTGTEISGETDPVVTDMPENPPQTEPVEPDPPVDASTEPEDPGFIIIGADDNV